MRIGILGAGAMGMLFGGYLSRENRVWLIDVDRERVERINREGVAVEEKEGETLFHPQAVTDSSSLPVMDLVIVFVKAMYTQSALETNRHLLGENTYLMTLQNGAGHEHKLLPFADREHVIIGSTQHNSSVAGSSRVRHGGGGKTSIGLLSGDSRAIAPIAENFTRCGFECATSDQVQKQIWSKLFLNTSASSLTAVLQVPLGFILDDPYACSLMEKLAREAVATANAEGLDFTEEEVLESIKTVLSNGKGGYTSIYADIKNGNRTEVDTISGSVVEAAREKDIPVPCHETIVTLIHAMENRNRLKAEG